jgi:hypothetical protein
LQNAHNKKYGSNQHGLKADFLEMFDYSLNFERSDKKNLEAFDPKEYEIDFQGVHIQVDYSRGLPVFSFDYKV